MNTQHADIPNDWWPSFSTPGPLVGIGSQESAAKTKDLAKRQKQLKKQLNGAQRRLLSAKRRLLDAHPSRVFNNLVGTRESGPIDEVPVDKLVFGVRPQAVPEANSEYIPKSFKGGWLPESSQAAMARAAVDHSKCLTRIVELEEALKALNEEAKGE